MLEVLVNQLLQSTVCFSCEDGGHRINRCPQVNADFPFLPMGWSMNMDNGQYRATRMNQTFSGGAGKRAAVRAGGSASRTSGDQSSTDPGGGFHRNKQRKFHWCIPGGNSKRGHWTADSQEFPSLETQQRTAGNRKRSAGPSTAEVALRRALRRRSSGIWTGGYGWLKTVILGHGESRRP